MSPTPIHSSDQAAPQRTARQRDMDANHQRAMQRISAPPPAVPIAQPEDSTPVGSQVGSQVESLESSHQATQSALDARLTTGDGGVEMYFDPVEPAPTKPVALSSGEASCSSERMLELTNPVAPPILLARNARDLNLKVTPASSFGAVTAANAEFARQPRHRASADSDLLLLVQRVRQYLEGHSTALWTKVFEVRDSLPETTDTSVDESINLQFAHDLVNFALSDAYRDIILSQDAGYTLTDLLDYFMRRATYEVPPVMGYLRGVFFYACGQSDTVSTFVHRTKLAIFRRYARDPLQVSDTSVYILIFGGLLPHRPTAFQHLYGLIKFNLGHGNFRSAGEVLQWILSSYETNAAFRSAWDSDARRPSRADTRRLSQAEPGTARTSSSPLPSRAPSQASISVSPRIYFVSDMVSVSCRI